MNSVEEKTKDEKYLHVPCSQCGEHYWKIPDREGSQNLRCAKCKGETRIVITKNELRVFPV